MESISAIWDLLELGISRCKGSILTSLWRISGNGSGQIRRTDVCALLMSALLIVIPFSAVQVNAKAFTSESRDISLLASKIQLLEKELLKHRLTSKDYNSLELRSEVVGKGAGWRIPGMNKNVNIREFDRAFDNFISGNDNLAISGFKSFVGRYPRHPLGAKAEISLAQIYLDWGNYDLASVHFKNAQTQFQRLTNIVVRRESARAGSKSQTSRDSIAEGNKVNQKNDVSSWAPDLPDLLTPDQKSDQLALSRPHDSAPDESHAAGEALINDFAINVGDRVFFDTDSSELSPASQRVLRNQVRWLRKYPGMTLTLEGHSDERGTREYNLGLSARRAAAAANFLQQEGISSRRIRTISYGKERPVALCDNVSCWAQNRRVITRLNFPKSAVISQKKKPKLKKRKNVPEWDANYSGSLWFVQRLWQEI